MPGKISEVGKLQLVVFKPDIIREDSGDCSPSESVMKR
jgi:hypothetical protein